MLIDDLEQLLASANYAEALKLIRKKKDQINEEWNSIMLSSLIDATEYQLEVAQKLNNQLASDLEWALVTLASHVPRAQQMKRYQRAVSIINEVKR